MKRSDTIAAALGTAPVAWLALKLAPYIQGGLPEILARLPEITDKPLDIALCPDSAKTLLAFLAAYGIGLGIAASSRRNTRRGEEHGSAKWGDIADIKKKFQQKPEEDNKILTMNVLIGLDTHKHRLNLNIIIIGGSGSGKSRTIAIPNLLQGNTSFFVLDPKGNFELNCIYIAGQYMFRRTNAPFRKEVIKC